MTIITQNPIAERVASLDWSDLRRRLDSDGFAVTHPLLSAVECGDLAALFDDEERFRCTGISTARSTSPFRSSRFSRGPASNTRAASSC